VLLRTGSPGSHGGRPMFSTGREMADMYECITYNIIVFLYSKPGNLKNGRKFE
jgi:hypothetical protein